MWQVLRSPLLQAPHWKQKTVRALCLFVAGADVVMADAGGLQVSAYLQGLGM